MFITFEPIMHSLVVFTSHITLHCIDVKFLRNPSLFLKFTIHEFVPMHLANCLILMIPTHPTVGCLIIDIHGLHNIINQRLRLCCKEHSSVMLPRPNLTLFSKVTQFLFTQSQWTRRSIPTIARVQFVPKTLLTWLHFTPVLVFLHTSMASKTASTCFL